ncbi:hypothetical protein TRIUR3_19446 [Triticum urartu]|uniref:O-fucosyltransferase family protein n=1 Tax=Triticum urartu TaxID=4572 RepID=M8A329_TRIUA|nr:hypothetical protein TRIUR3_19446 [Triticum urartu]
MLLYMGSLPLDVVPRIITRSAPGSVYRSPQLYARLRPDMDADNSTDAICNAVAIAGFLNATLIIPNFHFHSIWKDPSKFRDIYDEEHFVKRLQNDVRVVNKVPDFIMERFGHNLSNVFNFKIKAWSSSKYYKDVVLPKLVEERGANGYPKSYPRVPSDGRELGALGYPRTLYAQIFLVIQKKFKKFQILFGIKDDQLYFVLDYRLIRISPFANRLSFDAPPVVQRLRCLVNFEALKFSNPIATLSETLISRMREKSAESNGKYIAVHLRFEEDMVAFSCCVYDGGDEEKKEMDVAREIGWRGKFTKRGKVIRPGVIRMNGKCPLTPLEVGLMLRGMGFSNKTAIYLASGKIYKSEKTMAPLLEMFPLLQTKETLASDEELAPFKMEVIETSLAQHESTQ